jgi:hypothetical protein
MIHPSIDNIMVLIIFVLLTIIYRIIKTFDELNISIHEKNIDILNLKNKYLYSKVIKDYIYDICEVEEHTNITEIIQ